MPTIANSSSQTKQEIKNVVFPSLLTITTTPYNVTTNQFDTIFDNYGTNTIITFNLPTATVGVEYTFRRITSFNVIIDPNGTEIFSDSAVTKTLTSNNSFINIKCFINGIWHIMASSGDIVDG